MCDDLECDGCDDCGNCDDCCVCCEQENFCDCCSEICDCCSSCCSLEFLLEWCLINTTGNSSSETDECSCCCNRSKNEKKHEQTAHLENDFCPGPQPIVEQPRFLAEIEKNGSLTEANSLTEGPCAKLNECDNALEEKEVASLSDLYNRQSSTNRKISKLHKYVYNLKKFPDFRFRFSVVDSLLLIKRVSRHVYCRLKFIYSVTCSVALTTTMSDCGGDDCCGDCGDTGDNNDVNDNDFSHSHSHDHHFIVHDHHSDNYGDNDGGEGCGNCDCNDCSEACDACCNLIGSIANCFSAPYQFNDNFTNNEDLPCPKKKKEKKKKLTEDPADLDDNNSIELEPIVEQPQRKNNGEAEDLKFPQPT